MATIDVDIEHYLYEVSDEDLIAEIADRQKRNVWKGAKIDLAPGIDPWSPIGLAADIRQAYYARNANQLERCLVVLENHEGVEG